MKKTLITIGIIILIIWAILWIKYYMCKNNQNKVLGSNVSGQDLLNAAKPCKFFSLN